jgi:UDP-glucose 6-dehydrogenase
MNRSTVRNFVVSAALLVVAGSVFGYVYVVIGNKEKVLKEQIAAIHTENEREQTYQRLQKIAEDSRADREKLNAYFLPQVSESITFLNQIETLAPQNGITLKTDSLQEGGDKKTKEKWIDASFTFSGAEADVERFITMLENLPYVSRITKVQLSTQDQDIWEAKVTIRAFIINHEK